MIPRRRQSGHTLAGTMVFLALAMLLWGGVCRQWASYLRTETARVKREEKTTGLRQAMAWALSLLETGRPPLGWGDRYYCRMVIDGHTYVVRFVREDDLTYSVRVRAKQYAFEDFYPLAPASF